MPGAWSDWVGVVASIGCAIHCAAMPFVIAYLPALGLSFLADEAFHKWMALACFVIALTAFIPGLRKHGRLTPVAVASVGLVMISVAAFGFAGECCPACESAASGGSSAGESSLAASTSTAACTDADCQLCASKNTSESAGGAGVSSTTLAGSQQQASPWAAAIAPWLTPLGGIVLVSAHLLNRRYGCLCGCCDTRTPQAAAE